MYILLSKVMSFVGHWSQCRHRRYLELLFIQAKYPGTHSSLMQTRIHLRCPLDLSSDLLQYISVKVNLISLKYNGILKRFYRKELTFLILWCRSCGRHGLSWMDAKFQSVSTRLLDCAILFSSRRSLIFQSEIRPYWHQNHSELVREGIKHFAINPAILLQQSS